MEATRDSCCSGKLPGQGSQDVTRGDSAQDRGWAQGGGGGEGSGGTAEGGDASAGGPRRPRVSPTGKDDYDAHLAQVTTSENAPRLTR